MDNTLKTSHPLNGYAHPHALAHPFAHPLAHAHPLTHPRKRALTNEHELAPALVPAREHALSHAHADTGVDGSAGVAGVGSVIGVGSGGSVVGGSVVNGHDFATATDTVTVTVDGRAFPSSDVVNGHAYAVAPVVNGHAAASVFILCSTPLDSTPDDFMPAGLDALAPSSISISTQLYAEPRDATHRPDANPDAKHLLDGLGVLIRFLLDEEASHLCGVPRRMRSTRRVNFRGGYRDRKLRTSLGTISLRVPLLRYLHPRVSIVKRAKRLSPDIFAQLARLRASADGATSKDAAALIKALWTVTLSAGLLASLAGKLTPLLEEWRANANAITPCEPITPCTI